MKIILVGFGFIGRTFVKALFNKTEFLKLIDNDFKLIGVSDIEGYLYDENGLNLEKLSTIQKVTEYPGLINGSSVDLIEKYDANILVETTPTNVKNGEPGITHFKKALNKGMHVITSNKGPMVFAFKELIGLAERNGCELRYEATVAGAVPVFSLVKKCLQGNKILKISGILNGTTNYILSKMHFDGENFQQALAEAQKLRIAELDPSYDVDGIDPAAKTVILANSMMGRNATLDDVRITGIRNVDKDMIKIAKETGSAIKLVCTIDDTIEVAPKPVPLNSTLCVHNILNVLVFETDLAGQITVIGHGAGKETVSAIVNDLIDILSKFNSKV